MEDKHHPGGKDEAESFSGSWIVFETVNKKYTQGIRRRMVESKMKRSTGTTAGSSY
jgi:hypothetical protein